VKSPDRRRTIRLAAFIRLRRPRLPRPTLRPSGAPGGPARASRPPWSRATDPRWFVSRRPCGSLVPASRPSPASEAPSRLS